MPNRSKSGAYVIQVGYFSNIADADRTRSRFQNIGPVEVFTVATDSDILFEVRIGPLNDPVQARGALKDVMSAGYHDAKLIAPVNAL